MKKGQGQWLTFHGLGQCYEFLSAIWGC